MREVIAILFLSTLQIATHAADIVYDPTSCMQIINNGATATQQLNTATNELSTLNTTYNLAVQNSQSLQVNNWNDVSQLITETNAMASVPQSMTWATANAVGTFTQLFPGDNKTTQYLNDITQRSTGAINTFKGSLAAVQNLGNALNDYKAVLAKIQGAQSAVQGHESSAEQSNQIQGNILNTLQSTQMSEMSAASSATTYYAYEVQQKQIETESNQRFLSNGNIDPTYKNEGTGEIPSL